MIRVSQFQEKLLNTWPTTESDAMPAPRTSAQNVIQSHITLARRVIKRMHPLVDSAVMS